MGATAAIKKIGDAAAKIVGATAAKKFWSITLGKVTQQFLGPNIKPSQGFKIPLGF